MTLTSCLLLTSFVLSACSLSLVQCPETYVSPENVVLTRMFTKLLVDYLNEVVYPAELAGLGYSVSNTLTGFHVSDCAFHEMSLLVNSTTCKLCHARQRSAVHDIVVWIVQTTRCRSMCCVQLRSTKRPLIWFMHMPGLLFLCLRTSMPGKVRWHPEVWCRCRQ